MASRFLYSRARGIFSVGWNGVTRIRVASAGKRFVTQEKPISRFPIPNIDTLPQDIQERMNQVEEQVWCKIGRRLGTFCASRDTRVSCR